MMTFISLVDEIQFMLISNRDISIRSVQRITIYSGLKYLHVLIRRYRVSKQRKEKKLQISFSQRICSLKCPDSSNEM